MKKYDKIGFIGGWTDKIKMMKEWMHEWMECWVDEWVDTQLYY